MRMRNVTIGLWLLAAACGGQGGETRTASASDETMGGEPVRAPTRASAPFDEEEAMSREEVAMEVPEAPTEAPMEETESVAQAAGVAPDSPSAMQHAIGQERNSCPADLEGLEVSVATVPRGGALVFRADADEGEALRGRLRLFAKLHEVARQEQVGQPPIEKPAEDPDAIARAQTVREFEGPVQPKLERNPEPQRFADADALIHQASDVRMIETPRGARLDFRFEDGARVRDLREELRADAEQLRAGNCPLALSVES